MKFRYNQKEAYIVAYQRLHKAVTSVDDAIYELDEVAAEGGLEDDLRDELYVIYGQLDKAMNEITALLGFTPEEKVEG